RRAAAPDRGARRAAVTGRRLLVVSGDDFGAAPEVNAAIVRAHRDGILTSASLMVTGDAVEEAVALARAHPRLAVGLHLVLAPRYDIRALRLSRESLGSALRYDRTSLPRKVGDGHVFRALAAWSASRLRRAGIVTADRVYGMHQTGHVDERYLLSVIAALPPGVHEIYCHPAEAQPAALAPHQRGYDHAREVAALVSPRVREALRATGVE